MKNIIRNFAFFLASFLICLSQGCDKQGWISQESGTTNNILGVWFAGVDTGTVVGVGGTILHTTNGGETWDIQNIGNGPNFKPETRNQKRMALLVYRCQDDILSRQ